MIKSIKNDQNNSSKDQNQKKIEKSEKFGQTGQESTQRLGEHEKNMRFRAFARTRAKNTNH